MATAAKFQTATRQPAVLKVVPKFTVEKGWTLIGGYEVVYHLWCGKGPACTFRGNDAEARANECGRIWADTGVWPSQQGMSYGLPVGGAA